MSRSCTSAPLLSFTETLVCGTVFTNCMVPVGDVAPGGLGAQYYGYLYNTSYPNGEGSFPTAGYIDWPPGTTITHNVAATVTSTETYTDVGYGSIGGAYHLPGNGTVYVSEQWIITPPAGLETGGTFDVSRTDSVGAWTPFIQSNSWGFGVGAIGNLGAYAYAPILGWYGVIGGSQSHTLSNVKLFGQTVNFANYSWTTSGIATAPPFTGTYSASLSASGNTLTATSDCTVWTGPPILPDDALSSNCPAALLIQRVTSTMAWEVILKPTDSQGNGISIPGVSVIFATAGDPYTPTYTTTLNAPFDTSLTFSGECYSQLVSTWLYNPLPPPATPNYPWNGPNTLGDPGSLYHGCGFTRCAMRLPSAQGGPLSWSQYGYSSSLGGSSVIGGAPPNPTCYEVFPRHFWHPAAGVTYQPLATVGALPSSVSLPSSPWTLPNSTPGASVSGSQLTAGTAQATFNLAGTGENTFSTLVAPRRWIQFDLTASEDGQVEVFIFGSSAASIFASLATYTVSVVSGTNTIYVDLCNQHPGGNVLLVPAPLETITGLWLTFSSNVINVSSISAVIRDQAQFNVLGGTGQYSSSFWGHCDGNPAFYNNYSNLSSSNEVQGWWAGPANSVGIMPPNPGLMKLSYALTQLTSEWGLPVSGVATIPPVTWMNDQDGQATCFAAMFDASGNIQGPFDPTSGFSLYYTAWQSEIDIYGGCRQDAMFGGGQPFIARAEYVIGSVAQIALEPQVSETCYARAPQLGQKRPIWQDSITTDSNGYGVEIDTHNPLTGAQVQTATGSPLGTSGCLGSLYDKGLTAAGGGAGSAVSFQIAWNRTLGYGYSPAFKSTGGNPFVLQTPVGYYHRVQSKNGNIYYERSDSTIPLPAFAVEQTVTSDGTNFFPKVANDYLERTWLVYSQIPDPSTCNVLRMVSDDDGETWSQPQVIFSNMKYGTVATSYDGAIVFAAFQYNSGTSGPGTIWATYRQAGDTSDGTSFQLSDSTNSPLQSADDTFHLACAYDAQCRWVLAFTRNGDSGPSDWYSTDNCRTWTQVGST